MIEPKLLLNQKKYVKRTTLWLRTQNLYYSFWEDQLQKCKQYLKMLWSPPSVNHIFNATAKQAPSLYISSSWPSIHHVGLRSIVFVEKNDYFSVFKLGLWKLKSLKGGTFASGLKVNDSKTELCLFTKNDLPPITLTINNFEIISKATINVLGVMFDSKLQWKAQIENVIKKSNKAKYAILKFFKLFLDQIP